MQSDNDINGGREMYRGKGVLGSEKRKMPCSKPLNRMHDNEPAVIW